MLTTPLTPVKPNLTRYVDAQMGIFDSALAELKRGKKNRALDVVHIPPN